MLQKDVARRAGVSVSYVSTLERGQPHSITGADLTPERRKVVALAEAVGGDVSEALALCGYASDTSAKWIFDLADGLIGFDDLSPEQQKMAQQLARQAVQGFIYALQGINPASLMQKTHELGTASKGSVEPASTVPVLAREHGEVNRKSGSKSRKKTG